VSQYDDRAPSRTAVSSGSSAARGDEYDRGYSRDYDYGTSARRDNYDDDSYPAEYSSGYSAGSGSTTALPPPQGFDDEGVALWRIGWTSGTDIGLLIIRLVLGGILAAHGAQKVFGWFNGAGLDGFATFLTEQGYRQADALSAAGGFAELVGGLLVVFGVFTPLAAAGLLSVMINAIWLQWDSGLFLKDGGFEFELVLAGIAAGLVFTGPGRVSLDNGRAWFRHSVATGWICLLIGAGVGVGVYLFYHGL
jgi:putative oxidoreductase